MSSGEAVDMAVRTYRRLGWTFLRLTLVPSLFCLAAVAFVLDYVLPSLTITHHANNVGGQLGEAGVTVLLGLFIGGPLFILGLSYTTAVVIQLTSAYLTGGEIDPERANLAARGLLWTMFQVALRELLISLAGVLASLVLMGIGALSAQYMPPDSPWSGILVLLGGLGMAAGIIVFLYVVATHALAPAAALLEGASGKHASARSTWLMKGQWGHPSGVNTLFNCYLLMVVAGLVEWAGFAAVFGVFDLQDHFRALVSGIPFSGVLEAAFGLIPGFVVVWTVLPIWAVCVTIVYYERRIRLEGFDIEVLADEIGKTGRTSRFDV